MFMNLRTLTVGPVSCNCAIVACPETRDAAIIDPGGNADRILAAVRTMDVQVKMLLHTHGHFDHILATGEVAEATGAKVVIHQNDTAIYKNLPHQGNIFGFDADAPPIPNLLLVGEEEIAPRLHRDAPLRLDRERRLELADRPAPQHVGIEHEGFAASRLLRAHPGTRARTSSA